MIDRSNPKEVRIYQASTDQGVFVATVLDDKSELPVCPMNGEWELYTETALDGSNQAQYREDDAARDIEMRGYHMFRVVVRPNEVG